ncbi:S24 family peptidase [bacterium]|nr:S24 family peptidase [bacterium]
MGWVWLERWFSELKGFDPFKLSMEQQLEVCDWVQLPEPFVHKPGYFVVQVMGESMNKRIPNGAWCLFKADQGGTRNGKVVLVQSSHIQDAETGSSYTVKSYRSEKVNVEGEGWEHSKIVLSPMSSVERLGILSWWVISFRVLGLSASLWRFYDKY